MPDSAIRDDGAVKRKANRRHMIGDHHGRTAGRATLLIRTVDGILGTYRRTAPATEQVRGKVV
jgi:hypothetical protein